jgi:diguanylate cyclase (GGDEF)-like protein
MTPGNAALEGIMTSRLPHRLPGQITTVMAGTILVFGATLALSVYWLSRALDEQGRTDAGRLVQSALSTLESEMLAVNLEYAKWDDLVAAVEAQDVEWLYRNVGITAATGQMSDLVVLWGGALAQDTGWLDQSPVTGMARLVSARALAQADARLRAEVPLQSSAGVRFFVWRGSDLFAAAVSRVEGTLDLSRAQIGEDRIPRLLMGRRIARDQVEAITAKTLLTGLRIVRTPPQGRDAAPLPGPDGQPVAWLSWDAPTPGTNMLRRMLPILLPVTLLATGLGLSGMLLSRRSARNLVQAQASASVAAHTDPLTGLPNRAAFNQALAQPALAGERAVVFLDVNGFKRINDSNGHTVGDEVIVRLARRLEALAGPDCLLARIGGDEFVFVVTGSNAGFRAEWLAHAAERAIAPPFEVAGHVLQLQAAMGHAVQSSDRMAGGDLVRQADLAMYEAKRRRSRDPVAFGEMIEQASHDAQAIERALRDALSRPGELWVAYQPLVSAERRALARAEALARWTSPELGAVPPDRFIAVAERAGLIVELGRRLLGLVCSDLVAYPSLRVSVNISPLQLMAPDFVAHLIDTLHTRGIDPARMQVELTESIVVDDSTLAARRIRELQEAGFSTALDDFGTGYSSIGTLRQLDFDTLKIDRSFVSGLGGAPQRLALINAMILLAHALGLKVVCEGVETEEELCILREVGCDLVQGYGIDRPLPIESFAARWLPPVDEPAAVA